MPTLPPWVRLLRPHQYAKNLLVFSAPGAAGRLDEPRVAGLALAAFVLFCAVSSAGYVLNDLLDAEADRRHPVKRDRPIANGSVSSTRAKLLIVLLGGGSLVLSVLVGGRFAGVLAAYAAVSVTYSTIFKRIPWIDLFAVSSGFLLRAVAGGTATDTPLSGWFLLVVSAGALLLITGKRVGEFITLGGDSPSRRVLQGYTLIGLRRLAAVAAALAVGGYAAWAAAEAADQAADSGRSFFLRLTALPFTIAIGRYLMLSWHGAGETPESLVMRDRIVVVSGVAWAASYTVGLYA